MILLSVQWIGRFGYYNGLAVWGISENVSGSIDWLGSICNPVNAFCYWVTKCVWVTKWAPTVLSTLLKTESEHTQCLKAEPASLDNAIVLKSRVLT